MTSERANELLHEMAWSDLCTDYPAEALQEALEERLEERVDIQEMEMRVILTEIFTRLAERDTLKMKYRTLFHEAETLRKRLRDEGKIHQNKVKQIETLKEELESLRVVDRERVRLLDQQRLGAQR
jgi:hypothetical protein